MPVFVNGRLGWREINSEAERALRVCDELVVGSPTILDMADVVGREVSSPVDGGWLIYEGHVSE